MDCILSISFLKQRIIIWLWLIIIIHRVFNQTIHCILFLLFLPYFLRIRRNYIAF